MPTHLPTKNPLGSYGWCFKKILHTTWDVFTTTCKQWGNNSCPKQPVTFLPDFFQPSPISMTYASGGTRCIHHRGCAPSPAPVPSRWTVDGWWWWRSPNFGLTDFLHKWKDMIWFGFLNGVTVVECSLNIVFRVVWAKFYLVATPRRFQARATPRSGFIGKLVPAHRRWKAFFHRNERTQKQQCPRFSIAILSLLHTKRRSHFLAANSSW